MKKYYFKKSRKRGLGYFVALVFVAAIYFFFKDWFFSNIYIAPAVMVLAILILIVVSLLVDHNSYLAVDEKNLTFIRLFQMKWVVPITDIATLEEYALPIRTIEKASSHIGGRPRTGIRLSTNSGNTYEAAYNDRLVKFKNLTKILQQINPGIRLIPNPDLQDWGN